MKSPYFSTPFIFLLSLRHLINFIPYTEWYDPREGQFSGVGWWHTGNCLTTFVEYAQRTQNSTLYSPYIADMYAKNGNFTTEGYLLEKREEKEEEKTQIKRKHG